MLKKNKLVHVILAFALSAAVAVSFSGCGSSDSSASSAPSSAVIENNSSEESSADLSSESSASAEGTTVGEGENQFAFEVVLEDGSTTLFQVMTDETTVGAALLDLNLIEGDESEYGLYVKTVNGVTADYDADGKYWAFYVDGEYASTGVDSTDIVPGSCYSFKIEG